MQAKAGPDPVREQEEEEPTSPDDPTIIRIVDFNSEYEGDEDDLETSPQVTERRNGACRASVL